MKKIILSFLFILSKDSRTITNPEDGLRVPFDDPAFDFDRLAGPAIR
jgi:hypothetical protein